MPHAIAMYVVEILCHFSSELRVSVLQAAYSTY